MLAFDVGGSTIKSCIVRAGNEVIGLQRTATPRDPADPGGAVVGAVAELTAGYHAAHPTWQFAGAGLIVPGLVDERAGIGVLSTNLGWRNYPFAARATAELGMPVAFGHDVGAAGEAEFRFGAARTSENALVLINGTGIAAAVFCDGMRVVGAGYAGELGHAPVPDPDDPTRTVILEAVGSAGGIRARYAARTGRFVAGAREVLRLAESGDDVAARLWREAVDALALSIASCVALLGSDTVVIGGGLAQAGESLLGPLRSGVDLRLSLPRRPRIVPALLGESAGLLGAALKVRQASPASRID
ncbi:MAG TPA: ROK family protein [Propionibacteriaceae bacterium]|nr:ROK family protein [Propionibacteriaceae bacterium]